MSEYGWWRLLLHLKQEKVRLRKNSSQAVAALSPGLDRMVYHVAPFQPTFLHHREAPGSWRNLHQQSSNGRTIGVSIQQEHKDPKSLSPQQGSVSWGDKDKIHTRNAYKRREKERKKEKGPRRENRERDKEGKSETKKKKLKKKGTRGKKKGEKKQRQGKEEENRERERERETRRDRK